MLRSAATSSRAASARLALTSSHVPGETLDLFLTREAAEAELREILQDEPDWKDVLRVEPIRLDAQQHPLTRNQLVRTFRTSTCLGCMSSRETPASRIAS